MRIALLGPSFIPNRSYQENVWAEQLARAGHDVRVIYAGQATSAAATERGTFGTFETQTVATRFLPRGTYKSKGLDALVRAYRPDLIVVCGDKLFSLAVVRCGELANVPLISTYSENLGMHEFDWRKRGITLRQRAWALAFTLYRGGPIRTMCRRSALVIGNTPQARAIILRLFRSAAERASIEARLVDMPLGFSPEHFHFDPAVRQDVRAKWGVAAEEVVVVASSAFTAVKGPYIKMIVRAMTAAMKRDGKLRGVLVGFSTRPEYEEVSQEVAELITQAGFGDRFIREGFAQRERLSQVYNGSDIAVFGRASISAQESLGTGLVGCFANDGSLNHLVTHPRQGVFFTPGEEGDLARAIEEASEWITAADQAGRRQEMRGELEMAARWLGYDQIIARVFGQLRERGVSLPA